MLIRRGYAARYQQICRKEMPPVHRLSSAAALAVLIATPGLTAARMPEPSMAHGIAVRNMDLAVRPGASPGGRAHRGPFPNQGRTSAVAPGRDPILTDDRQLDPAVIQSAPGSALCASARNSDTNRPTSDQSVSS